MENALRTACGFFCGLVFVITVHGCETTEYYRPAQTWPGYQADRDFCSAQAKKAATIAYDSVSYSSIVVREYNACLRGKEKALR